VDQSPQGQGPQGFASEDEEATYCLSLLRDGDRQQKVVARERLSQIFERRGMLDEAAQCLESNIREGVRDPRIYQRLAGVYRRQGRHELAEEVMVEARRLAERMARVTGPGQRRPGPPQRGRPVPPPPNLEAPTAQLPVTAGPPPVPMPAPPPAPQYGRPAPGFGDELGLDAAGPAPGYGVAGPPPSEAVAVNRPWWLSPAMAVLLILLCGPYGVAMFWVRGGYSKATRTRVTAIWAGLMILGLAGAAVALQSQLPSMLAAAGAGAISPGRTDPSPILFPAAPTVAAKPSQPQGQAPLPPTLNPAIGAIPPTRPAGTTIGPGAEPKPEATTPVPAEKPAAEKPSTAPSAAPAAMKVKVLDTGGTGANLRDKPGQTGTVIKTIPDGEVLEVIGPDRPMDGKSWKNVKDESGTEGWMASELLGPA
jgi:hypothetical protein